MAAGVHAAGLVEPQGYAHVGIATGTRTVYLAGQVGQDADGAVVGVGDLAAQTEQALVNVSIALDAAGASFDDVAKTTIYVVGWTREMMGPLFEGLGRAAARLEIDPVGPTTLVGVQALATPEILVEFDVTAVVA
ncbi:MAG: RidA family protein [Pseudonocardia sp.]